MPIYEFVCQACQKEFEKLVFRQDDLDVTCPECRSENVQKVMSASSIMAGKGLGACVSSPASSGFS